MTDPFPASMSEDDLYPSSDGQPMAETEFHADEMTEVKLMLRRHFRADRDRVYVGCNLFVYYERGNPRAVFSPDVFVVRGAPQRKYDTYKLWQDGPAPSWVLEVSSKSTHLEDRGNKKAVCEMLGVAEYFLYDPRAEYLRPPLQGFRLRDGAYHSIEAMATGAILAETLGIEFSLDELGLLVLSDAGTGSRLLRVDEERDSVAAERDRVAAERDRVAAERDRVAAERDRVAAERDRVAAERDREALRAAEAEAHLAEALAELEGRRR
jgi:Uma2 family endonuclease